MRTADQSRSSKRRFARIAVFVFFVALLAVTPAHAREWRISDFHTAINIDADGNALIIERISLAFRGQFNGIHRTIPVQYPGPRGTNYTLFLKVLNVRDANGQALKYDRSNKGDFLDLKIYIPGAVDTTKTVEITYTTPNAVRWFETHDEFYWNVTGNDWPVPIDRASAVVGLPANTSGSLRAQAFTGVYGSHDTDARSEVKGSTVVFETNNPLPMRGGMTVDIYIPKGLLHPPSAFTRAVWWIRSNSIVLMPVFAFAVMFTLWWYKGRDPKQGSIAAMYEPPQDMSPAEVGALVDDRIDPRDITSTVVDLAVRGFIKIEEVVEKRLLWDHKDYLLHLLKPEPWDGLRSHERVLLHNVFSNGNAVRLSSLKNHFYTAIPSLKQDIKAELKTKGMYSVDPDSASGIGFVAAGLIVAPFMALHILGIVNLLQSVPLLLLSAVLTLIILFLFSRLLTAKSIRGMRTKVHILGFEEFMNRVDRDRLQRMPPDTFEKFLPYAMALGVEERWAKAFDGLIQNPPTWYVGPSYGTGNTFHPVLFTNSMHSMSSDMHQVFVSAPRSSSTGSGFGGGGFSGGGFSGGGFGGGGGSAF